MLLPRESVMVAFPDATLAVAESDTADRVFALMFSNDALSPTDPNDMVCGAGGQEMMSERLLKSFFFTLHNKSCSHTLACKATRERLRCLNVLFDCITLFSGTWQLCFIGLQFVHCPRSIHRRHYRQ